MRLYQQRTNKIQPNPFVSWRQCLAYSAKIVVRFIFRFIFLIKTSETLLFYRLRSAAVH